MILYFTGTGNSLIVARHLHDKLGDPMLSLYDAVDKDLTNEKRIGFVYPTYMLDAPPAVRELVPKLRLPKDAYVFIVISCGLQTNNAVWTVRKLLHKMGVDVSYCNKIRFPDTAAHAYGRNANKQLWKLEKYAPRMDEITADIASSTHALHYAGVDPLACLFKWMPLSKEKMHDAFCPHVDSQKCVGCGLCSRICPQQNIAILNHRAAVGTRCTYCLRCLHFCPHQALVLTLKETKREYQYHHPEIRVQDFDTKA